MPFLPRRNHMPVAGRLVIITGGSQGMGLSVALILASKGAHIAIIARTQSKLDIALPQISAAARDAGQKFLAVSADLSSGVETERAFLEIEAWHGAPADIVWQCAGGTQPGYFKDYSAAELEAEMRSNYFTALHTAHVALRRMLAVPGTMGKRMIVLTSSVVAFYPLAGYNSYSPAKAAIRSLADGLRQECLLYDIGVHVCFPATIYTPGYEEEQKTKPELTKILEGSDEGQTPEKVAEVCVRSLERGEAMVATSLIGRAMMGGALGGSPRSMLEALAACVLVLVWSVVGRVLDWEVVKYRKKLAREGKEV